MKNILYGDGIHDDLPAIQEMLDSGMSLVYLPKPLKNYLISGTIFIHSNQELRLDRYTHIILKDGSDCSMIEDAEGDLTNQRITVTGGIWDMNNANQSPNPLHYPDKRTKMTIGEYVDLNNFRTKGKKVDAFMGACFRFFNIKEFYFGNLTIRNPVNFGVQIFGVEDFTIENIRFEYYVGAPKLWNLDGVHVEGCCKNGVIRNLKGTCHDDLVALTSDDGAYGPIENIVVDGIFAQNCHSAVRLLSRFNPVKNIHITNVFGTFYAYCMVISKFHGSSDERSGFENITIDNIYASSCKGTVDVPGNRHSMIVIGDGIDIKNMKISKFYRDETNLAISTIKINENTTINNLSVSECVMTNKTSLPFSLIENEGVIDKLYTYNNDCGDDLEIIGNGKINMHINR